MPIENKPQDKTMVHFVWSFKCKINPIGEMIKHKEKLCVHVVKKVKGIYYWNDYAPVVQDTTTRLMSIHHKINKWKCRHLDYVLAFSQERPNTDVCLRILAGFHAENENVDDVSDQYCLKLLKICYGTKDAASNWFAVL